MAEHGVLELSGDQFDRLAADIRSALESPWAGGRTPTVDP
jgi:hypothetical protein